MVLRHLTMGLGHNAMHCDSTSMRSVIVAVLVGWWCGGGVGVFVSVDSGDGSNGL